MTGVAADKGMVAVYRVVDIYSGGVTSSGIEHNLRAGGHRGIAAALISHRNVELAHRWGDGAGIRTALFALAASGDCGVGRVCISLNSASGRH